MKSFTISLALLVASASAQYNATTPSAAPIAAPSDAATSVITIKPGCPTAAPADVMVTRSAIAVPSCAAGANETKPVIVSMATMPSGSMGAGEGGANATKTGSPAQFTGAASVARVGGVLALVGGVVAVLL